MGRSRNKDRRNNHLRTVVALLTVVRTALEAGQTSFHGRSPHEEADEAFRWAGPQDQDMHDVVYSPEEAEDSTKIREEYSQVGMEDVGCRQEISKGLKH